METWAARASTTSRPPATLRLEETDLCRVPQRQLVARALPCCASSSTKDRGSWDTRAGPLPSAPEGGGPNRVGSNALGFRLGYRRERTLAWTHPAMAKGSIMSGKLSTTSRDTAVKTTSGVKSLDVLE